MLLVTQKYDIVDTADKPWKLATDRLGRLMLYVYAAGLEVPETTHLVFDGSPQDIRDVQLQLISRLAKTGLADVINFSGIGG